MHSWLLCRIVGASDNNSGLTETFLDLARSSDEVYTIVHCCLKWLLNYNNNFRLYRARGSWSELLALCTLSLSQTMDGNGPVGLCCSVLCKQRSQGVLPHAVQVWYLSLNCSYKYNAVYVQPWLPICIEWVGHAKVSSGHGVASC
jgi:hypothetical protein